MALYDPASGAKIPQAGTFNGNPVTMAAGLATLRELTPEVYARLDFLAKQAADGLCAAFAAAGIPATVSQVGSLFRLHLLPDPPRNYREAAQEDRALQQWLFFWLLRNDILWTTGGNVSAAIEADDVDRLVATVRSGLQAYPG
jgi:glutamate-1-semialdehyde 2,1-aminomutase